MKSLRYIVLLILCLFTFNVYAIKVSHYEPTFEMDEEFKNNQIITYYGFTGEDTYKTEFKITIDTNKLKLKQAFAGENYKVEYKEVDKSGSDVTYQFTYISSMVTNKYIFGGITFDLSDSFKINNQSEMKVFDIYSYNDDGSKYRSEGYYIVFKREGNNNMLALRTDINNSTKTKRVINFLLPFIIVGVVALFLIFIVIVIMPNRKQSNIKGKIDAQLDPKNYPIPGVGPLPKMKKKDKKDVIEPEEKTIMPLSEFVSKSEETNDELKNQPIEVDKEMFKDNPTKEGEDGLININPLAFDDGQEEVLDDGRASEEKTDDDDDVDIL